MDCFLQNCREWWWKADVLYLQTRKWEETGMDEGSKDPLRKTWEGVDCQSNYLNEKEKQCGGWQNKKEGRYSMKGWDCLFNCTSKGGGGRGGIVSKEEEVDSVSVRESHDVRMREFHRSLVSKKLTMRLLNSLTKSGNFPGRGVESQFSERWRVKWVRAGLRNDEKKKRREWNQTRLFSFSIFHSIRTETHWIERRKRVSEWRSEE